MGVMRMMLITFGIIVGMACGVAASALIGLPPLAMIGIGAGVGAAIMAGL